MKNTLKLDATRVPGLKRSRETSHRMFSSTINETDKEDDKPISYSKSLAAKWSSRETFGEVPEHKRPPALQSPVIVISIAVFLIYFCILREENDVDEELTKPLSEQIKLLQKTNTNPKS